MNVTYLRAAGLGILALQLGACTENPLDPSLGSAARSASEPSATEGLLASHVDPRSDPSFDLFALSGGDFVPIMINGAPIDGAFSAKMLSRPGTQLGAIRIEWGSRAAKDGKTVEIELVTLDLSPLPIPWLIEFSGVATITDLATGRVEEFPVTGTAQQSTSEPDCVLFDILGGDLYAVELPGRFKILG
ncbi:MAG: hypothetical protein ABFS14_04325 [Gemmatimonadota bacterium]